MADKILIYNKNTYAVKNPYKLYAIELTNNCIMQCVMCIRTYGMKRPKGFMSYEMLRSIVDQYVVDNPHIHETTWFHLFGESLLHPEFETLMRYARRQGLFPGLSVNPFLVDEKMTQRLIDSGITEIYFSLDGYDEESYSKLRGVSGKYERAKESILKFLESKHKFKLLHVTVGTLSFPAANEREEQAKRLFGEFWSKQKGVDNFFFRVMRDWNGSIKNITEISQKEPRQKCFNPYRHLYIYWDGTVVGCCYDHDQVFPVGHVGESRLTDIWNNEKMRLLRKELATGDVENPLCKDCRFGPNPNDKLI